VQLNRPAITMCIAQFLTYTL